MWWKENKFQSIKEEKLYFLFVIHKYSSLNTVKWKNKIVSFLKEREDTRQKDPGQKWWNYDFIKVKDTKALGPKQILAKTLIIARIGLIFLPF